MAVTFTELTEGSATGGGGSANPWSTASVTPEADQPVYLAVAVAVSGGFTPTDALAVDGCGLTWTKVAGGLLYGGRRMLWIYRGVGASPTTDTIDVTYSGDGGNGVEKRWSVQQAAGADTTTPEGTAYNATTTTASPITVTVSDTPDAGDAILAVLAGAESAGYTAEGGWTEVTNVSAGSDVRSLVVMHDDGADTSPSFTFTNTGAGGAGALAFVVNAGVTDTPPENTVAPAITGTEQVGETLSLSDGTWTGTPTPTYSYRWFACGPGASAFYPGGEGTFYTELTGETGATLLLDVAWEGDYIFAVVEASNTEGDVEELAAEVGPVLSAGAVTPDFPLVDDFDRGGSPQGTLGSDYQIDPWLLGADSMGVTDDEATASSGYAESTYVTEAYEGDNGCAVLLGNAPTGGSTEAGVSLVEIPRATSAQGYRAVYRAAAETWELLKRAPAGGSTFTEVIAPVEAPWVEDDFLQVRRDGGDMVLELLSGETTTELGRAEDTSYSAAQYASLYVYTPSGTAASFKGFYIGGTLVEDPPVFAEDPSLSGVAIEEEDLVCSSGVCTGNPTFAYQWRTVAAGEIADADSATFTVTAAEVGESVFCRVTATNAYGSDVADSNTVVPTAIPEVPDPDGFMKWGGEAVPTASRLKWAGELVSG